MKTEKRKRSEQQDSKKDKLSALGLDHHLPNEGQGRDEMIQIYSWEFEDAWKAQEEWENRYGPHARGRGPFSRWIGAQELKELYGAYRKKNIGAIIEALYVCSLNSLPIPYWCEMAFLASYRKVRQFRAKSWDDVFGRPHPKGIHLDLKRMERERSLPVYHRIREVNKNSLFGKKEKAIDWGIQTFNRNGQIKYYNPSAIGEKLFERVGKEFDISKTLAEEYYYRWKNKLERQKKKNNNLPAPTKK